MTRDEFSRVICNGVGFVPGDCEPAPDGRSGRVSLAVSIGSESDERILIRRLACRQKTGHKLELARELPHIVHGGRVLVQKTIPTDVPPRPAR